MTKTLRQTPLREVFPPSQSKSRACWHETSRPAYYIAIISKSLLLRHRYRIALPQLRDCTDRS